MLPIILSQKYTKSCLEHKTQVIATCDSSGPAHSHISTSYKRSTVSNVLYLDIE